MVETQQLVTAIGRPTSFRTMMAGIRLPSITTAAMLLHSVLLLLYFLHLVKNRCVPAKCTSFKIGLCGQQTSHRRREQVESRVAGSCLNISRFGFAGVSQVQVPSKKSGNEHQLTNTELGIRTYIRTAAQCTAYAPSALCARCVSGTITIL